MHASSFIEKYRSKHAPPENAGRPRTARSTNWFVKVHDAQIERLLEIEPKATQLFLILLRENRRHHGRPFVLPSDELVALPGLSRNRLRLMLGQLERAGLVLVTPRHKRPPLVQVPPAP
jgi:hypothetical protein